MLCGCGGRSVTSVAFVSIDARCILGQSVVFAHTYVWQMQRIGGRAVLVCDYCAGLHIVKTINPLSSLVFGHNSCLCHPQSQFLPLSTHVLQNYGVCGVLWSWVLFAVLGCFCEIAPACFFPGGGCMRCHGTVTGVVCVRAGCGHASGCGIWDVFHVFLPTLNAA